MFGAVSSNGSDPFLDQQEDSPHRTEDSKPLTEQELEGFTALNEMALEGASWLIEKARRRKAAQDLKDIKELALKLDEIAH